MSSNDLLRFVFISFHLYQSDNSRENLDIESDVTSHIRRFVTWTPISAVCFFLSSNNDLTISCVISTDTHTIHSNIILYRSLVMVNFCINLVLNSRL